MANLCRKNNLRQTRLPCIANATFKHCERSLRWQTILDKSVYVHIQLTATRFLLQK